MAIVKPSWDIFLQYVTVMNEYLSHFTSSEKYKKGEKDWPLDIQDHKGNWHKIYAEVGDMIMYESAVCEHGRTTPYEGEYFRNLFVHYKLKNWDFVDKNNG